MNDQGTFNCDCCGESYITEFYMFEYGLTRYSDFCDECFELDYDGLQEKHEIYCQKIKLNKRSNIINKILDSK